MWRLAALFGAAVLAAGCVTTSPNVGSGPLTLDTKAADAFERYRTGSGQSNPLVFAIASDARSWAWFTGAAGHGIGRSQEYQAIQFCETKASPGVTCKVFAHGPNIVWNGPVYHQGRILHDAAPNQPIPATPAPGIRAIAMSWDGYARSINGRIDVGHNGPGSIELSLPRADGSCDGNHRLTNALTGTWFVACTNGRAAVGELSVDESRNIVTGRGKDTRGRLVTFTAAATE